jgi:hypothetical protein
METSYNIHFELGIPWKLVALIKTCLNENCNIVLIGHICPESFLFRMA